MSFADVDALLASEVANRSFPGAVALVANASGVIHEIAIGAHTYDAAAAHMVLGTRFDVASVTKVIATTTCAMLLYQLGALRLSTPVVDLLGPAFSTGDPRKSAITVEHLLLHEAGFPPDPTPVSFCAPSFACPEYSRAPPAQRRLTFSCEAQAHAALLAQPLVREPGTKYQYSDLSMITMMYVIGAIAKANAYVSVPDLLPTCASESGTGIEACYYEAFARKHIFSRVGGADFMGFLLPQSLWPTAAPTWNDTASGFPGECVKPFRERVLQGEVSDGNAYALGGVAGHAGLFATAPQLHAVVSQLLFPEAGGSLGLNATTVRTFTTVHNASRSSRALGWDTQSGSHSLGLCGALGAATFTHTGYTGTQICADPTRGLLTILLTNRVYPRADDRSEAAIHSARIAFNDAVVRAVEA